MPVYMLVDTYTLTGILVHYHVHSIYLQVHAQECVCAHTQKHVYTHLEDVYAYLRV